MFEKEAEEWVKENMDCCKTDNSVNQSIPYFDEEERCCAKSAFQDGAEFGYNKANEWHDLRKDPNDLPIFETELLCQKYSGRCFVGYYHYNDNKFYPYEKGNSYDVTDVIAWKEIVLPKESE